MQLGDSINDAVKKVNAKIVDTPRSAGMSEPYNFKTIFPIVTIKTVGDHEFWATLYRNGKAHWGATRPHQDRDAAAERERECSRDSDRIK